MLCVMIRSAKSLGRQIKDLCWSQGITKAQLAERFLGGVSPSSLSHMVRRADETFMREIAGELNVPPEYFDEYIVSRIRAMVELDGRIVSVLRAFLASDSATREKWFRSSEKIFGLSE